MSDRAPPGRLSVTMGEITPRVPFRSIFIPPATASDIQWRICRSPPGTQPQASPNRVEVPGCNVDEWRLSTIPISPPRMAENLPLENSPRLPQIQSFGRHYALGKTVSWSDHQLGNHELHELRSTADKRHMLSLTNCMFSLNLQD